MERYTSFKYGINLCGKGIEHPSPEMCCWHLVHFLCRPLPLVGCLSEGPENTPDRTDKTEERLIKRKETKKTDKKTEKRKRKKKRIERS